MKHRAASTFSHLDPSGGARMVDIGAKPVTQRTAVAEGRLHCAPSTLRLLRAKALPKGDVLTVAKIAGIQAAKATATLIPLCHPLPPGMVDLEFKIVRGGIAIRSTVSVAAQTGAEMEALTAVSVAALTLYDMCKAVDKGMSIGGVRVVKKTKV
ncbi:MAG TPA: cyclic pyranopterin monophosphate synthase MoaC [Candidatus Didemnitutus sp.]|jgi:cyclic pyranopterin phosphate synthase